MEKILITICARGGSKGIPGKNIKDLNGKPVLHYTLELAQRLAAKWDAHIQLSTDDPAILNCAQQLGCRTDYVRPAALATDSAGKIDVIKDALFFSEKAHNIRYAYVLDLDVSSPLRTIEDVEAVFSLLKSREDAVNIFSVSPAARNPYFNMVEEKGDGFVKLVKDAGLMKSRQSAPRVFDMNASFYLFRRSYFEEGYASSITDKSMVYEVPHICFDLDEPMDFTIMELLLKEGKLNFTI